MSRKFFSPPVSTSNLYAPDLDKVLDIWSGAFAANGRLQVGSLVSRLEAELCRYHQAKYCVAFSTGFWALAATVALQAIPNRPEVIIPSLTYRRLADCVFWTGKTPRFVDVEPNNLSISPDAVEQAISDQISLILAVHPIVNCCDVDRLLQISNQHQIPIVFDAVESVHESIGSGRIGSFGVGEVFSFHASKLINGMEGGYVTTSDARLRDRLRIFRGDEPAHDTAQDADDSSPLQLRGIMNDGHAALALASLQEIDPCVHHNQTIYNHYKDRLQPIPGIRLLEFDERYPSSFKNIVVEVQDNYPLDRDALVQQLNSAGILARSYYSPALHTKQYEYPVCSSELNVTEQAMHRFLNLPCGSRLTVNDVDAICQHLQRSTGQ